MAAGEESCRSCGYSLEVTDSQFGHGAVSVERLTDADGNFTQEERNAIGAVQAEFERRFPQLFLMVYVGSPPVPASPGQFGFWLLNHAAVPSLDVLRPNERGLVLVVNPLAGTAALTAGYFLENCLNQKELDALLRSGFREFSRGDYVGAVRVIARRLTEKLCRRAREAARPDVLTGTGSRSEKKWFPRTRAGAGEPDIPAPPGGMGFPVPPPPGEPVFAAAAPAGKEAAGKETHGRECRAPVAGTGADPDFAEETDAVRRLSTEPAFSLETVEGEETLMAEGEEAGSGDRNRSGDKRADGEKSWVADGAGQAGRGAGSHDERAVK